MCGSEVLCSSKLLPTPWSIYRKFTEYLTWLIWFTLGEWKPRASLIYEGCMMPHEYKKALEGSKLYQKALEGSKLYQKVFEGPKLYQKVLEGSEQ